MILFKSHHVDMIKAGAKTQTRRVWKRPRAKIGSVHKVKTELFSPNYHCLIRIVDVHQERLGDISVSDVWAEGYQTLDEYAEVWTSINGVWDPDQLVYVVSFEVVR